ncbi:10416_t:CDS:1, partial [Racocetra persica]
MMLSSKTITALSCANKFSEDFVADNSILICRFCNYSVSFLNKSSVTSHIAGTKYIQRCVLFEKNQKNKLQQTMLAVLKSGKSKRKLICNLLEVW